MLQAKPRFQSFDEYLSYHDTSEKLYELFNGKLIEMPPESGLNIQIANRLFLVFALMIGTDRVRGQGLELEVRGEPKNRYPDLTIIRPEHIEQLSQRNTIRLSMLPPLLAIEVVSPGELQRDRDYVAKRIQYQDLSIPEYWIVDPQTQTILVLEITETGYTEIGVFAGDNLIISPQFRQLDLTAYQVFNPGS
ncbi:MAG: Uma2 family endonuclease [Limnospira sp. PMC 1279.21]|uniref:Uma2 family endonuclease n=3 Tax=Limnospira TaxID=2596745 RepID=A0ABU9EL75_LIMFS|nr:MULTISPECIES: Uma2 family endonuclease [Limnospira]QJB27051.1 Uma2 family endonuclease [Limnospira fusiformis SAG 85.79]MDT9178743.1 Uma2 family endonuclease [Limnospira sp. PMC 1238.20]MDT9219232.1 Uma2 family endonuclease [Limnospira sp. PMC 1240.20]MDT9224847.1 Uma2 family endonuclease [Limnospira sp. PMC 1279.21]MDT9229941.1 Uma2 family endonuclease [Limnospira sp. PMC 1242.20]